MWKLREGMYVLPGIGPGPFYDDDFEVLATQYGKDNQCDLEDVIQNGPYIKVAELSEYEKTLLPQREDDD